MSTGAELREREPVVPARELRPAHGLRDRLTRIAQEARASESVRVLAVFGACVLVWVMRRPEQLTRPYVWVEESFIIRNFLDDGWAGAFEPLQGYFILPASALVALAAELSFVQLPELAYAFSFAVFVGTVLLLLLPESRWGDLNARCLMALTMVLVPTNPEVFGIALYSFWWTTLWPVIVLGWKRDLWALRVPVLAVAALSSPAAGALFVVFLLAYALRRRLRELVSAAILLAGFVYELSVALDSTRAELLSRDADPLRVLEQTFRTAGLYEARWLSPASPDRYFLLLGGIVFVVFLVFAAVRLASARRHEALLLVAAAGIYTVLSAVPAPLITDPGTSGPRYFFLPFVVFGWVLLMLWRHADLARLRTAAALLLAASLLGLATTFSRGAELTAANLSWEEEVQKCARSVRDSFEIPIYFDGSTKLFWTLTISPTECRRLADAYPPYG